MDKEQLAIERIKLAASMSEQYYHKPVVVCISGGKDSDVVLELTKRSGVVFEVQHSLTTVDAPETVYHVQDQFRALEGIGINCIMSKPKMSMWDLIVYKKIPPTRKIRYCCEVLKETYGKSRHIMTGVRWAESSRRKETRGINEVIAAKKEDRIILNNDNDDKRLLTERCAMQAKTVTNPIIDWTDDDVYDYIQAEHININPLYCNGFRRVGCIGCPMAGRKMREMEFELYPTYKRAYLRAFEKMLIAREQSGMKPFIRQTAQGVFDWWMENRILEGQTNMFDHFE